MADRCREIAAQFGSAHVGMNSNYFASNSKSIDSVTVFGIAALVLAGGYVVIQSIFRISVNDKIQSYGQLRTIGATPRQIRRIVKKGEPEAGRDPSSGGVFHDPDPVTGAGCKAVFPGRRYKDISVFRAAGGSDYGCRQSAG